MKKVLILFCGGTLVMEENEQGALEAPTKDKAIANLLSMEPKLDSIAKIDLHYVDNIDSANMHPDHWDTMADVIEKNYDKYDGFVITHGTDSMAYTSSALSYSLQNLGKPVVLTGAQIPGGLVETDARRNFVNAVRVATMDLAGVMIVFDEEIILGSRATKVSESKLDAFETVNWDLLGEIRIDVRLSDEAQKRHNKKLKVVKGFEENVAIITQFPGFPSREAFEKILDSGVKGVIFRGYGSGNISSVYLSAIKKAQKKKIVVVVDSQCMEGATSMHLYDVGQQALDAGCIQAYDMSIESVVTKLMWALKHYPYKKIQEVMHTNYVGEINKEGKIY